PTPHPRRRGADRRARSPPRAGRGSAQRATSRAGPGRRARRPRSAAPRAAGRRAAGRRRARDARTRRGAARPWWGHRTWSAGARRTGVRREASGRARPCATMTPVRFDPYAAATQRDPYPAYQALRDDAPVYHDAERDFWALSRFDDVLWATHEP